MDKPINLDNREVELKLAIKTEDLGRLRQTDLLRTVRPGRRRLADVYYDTDDLALLTQGLALRIRQAGKRFEQTLKRGDTAGSLVQSRGEWKATLPGPALDFAAFKTDEPRELLNAIDVASLRPLFQTAIARERRILSILDPTGALSRIELAIDIGTISSNGRETPVSEVELELLEGSPTALYATALVLNESTPFRIAPLSKASRGYALAGQWRPSTMSHLDPVIADTMTVREAASAIFRDCMTRWTSNEAAALDGANPDGLHKMRVGLRRLRSAIALFQTGLASDSLIALGQEAKWVAQSLGDARDWDVFLSQTLRGVEIERPGDDDFAILREAAEAQRRQAYERAHQVILSPRYCSFSLSMGRWIEAPFAGESEPIPLIDFAKATLNRAHKKARKRGKRFARLNPAERHRLRVTVKKLRYSIDFFASLYDPEIMESYRLRLAGLQDELGLLNDVAVMEERLSVLVAVPEAGDPLRLGRAAGKVIGWYAHDAAAKRPSLVKRWKKFAKADPFWKG